jgi:tRNA dimethylallyltransferase
LKNHLVAVVGPTGVGKSRYALYLAQKYNGEIIGADSRQIYRYMDIGTAKPTVKDQAVVPHHLIDIIDPDQDFSLAEYCQLSEKVILEIQQQGKLPFLVGGTGQYVKAVLEGWHIPRVAPDTRLRLELEEKAAGGQSGELYQELTLLDPEAAHKIDPRNVRRVIRALEVIKVSGNPFSQQQTKNPPDYKTLIIGLTAGRKELYRFVDARVDGMISAGLIDEVKALLSKGYHAGLPAMSSIGYRQIISFLQGEMTLQGAVENTKVETHRFIRHQYNWFRLNDEKISWFDVNESETENQLAELVSNFLNDNRR